MRWRRSTTSASVARADLESTRQFAIEKFAQDLIAVKDSLELAVANAEKANADKADVASLIEGEKATLRLLAKAFEKAQIEEVNPQGQPFNPEFHEAMMAQPSDAPRQHRAGGGAARLPVERQIAAAGARDRVGPKD